MMSPVLNNQMKKYKEAAIQTAVIAMETIGTRIILRLPIIILADVLRTFTPAAKHS